MKPRPIIFLDLDDVIVLKRGASFDKHHIDELDVDICRQLIHPPAGQALTELLDEFAPSIVVTSKWVRFTTRVAFERLLRLAGYEQAAQSLHDTWCAPGRSTATRVQVIEEWLIEHHRDEPYIVIDDLNSGSGLLGSVHDKAGRVLLCPVGTGLHHGHLSFVRAALMAPPELTSEEAAKLLSVSRTHVNKLVKEGLLGEVRSTEGGHRRISRAAVLAYKAEMKIKQGRGLDKMMEATARMGGYEGEMAALPKRRNR